MTGTDDPTSHPPTRSAGLRAFLRLVTMLAPFRGLVILSALLAVLIVGARALLPWLTKVVIDDIDRGHYADISTDVALLVAAATLMALLNGVRRLVAGSISLGLEKQLRDRLYAHLSGLSFAFFDRHQTGQLLSRVTTDVTQVRFFLGYGLTYFFMHLATLIVVPVLCLLLSPVLAIVVLAMMPTIFFISLRFSRRSHPILKEIQQREADVTTAAEENITGARVVRAFGQEAAEVDRFRTLADRVVEKERESWRLTARYRPLYGLIPNVALAVVVLLAGGLIQRDAMTIGDFFAFYGYMLMLTGPLRIVGNLLSRAQRATASGERLWELLDDDARLQVRDEPLPLPAPTAGESMGAISLRNVCFSYRGGRVVIDDVTLDIEPGSTVALLGATGSGKTTLAALVPRFYDPDAGTVSVDGVDVRDLDLRELRTSVGVVDQEPFLFSDTVAGNLRFGDPHADEAMLWEVLRHAQAEEFVRRLPDGLDTLIGERGLTLSGGQRQRLAIARALLVDPRILILDDATASVDSRVEAHITGALRAATAGRTTILIAHRPSTIALADRVVIMDRGRIADQGTHDELLARNDLYQQIQEQRAARREFLLDPTTAATDTDRGDGRA